jgi:glutamate--cysteine ligase
MSDLGYRNTTQAGPGVTANSLSDYVRELRAAVSTIDPVYARIGVEVDGEYRQLNANILQIENEYYSSIRPKPRDRTVRPVRALERDGVEYLELRNLDSDPTELVGVGDRQMCVAELLVLNCLLADSPPITTAEQAEIDQRELTIAWDGRRPGLRIDRNGDPVAVKDWGYELADQLQALAEFIGHAPYREAAASVRAVFERPDDTPSARMIDLLTSRGTSLFDYAMGLADSHRERLVAYPFAPGREAELERAVVTSLAEAKALADRPEVPFGEYLARYFAE